MFQYKVLKIDIKDDEKEINKKMNDLGRNGWELVNFQNSSESHGVLKNVKPWTTTYVLIFKKEV